MTVHPRLFFGQYREILPVTIAIFNYSVGSVPKKVPGMTDAEASPRTFRPSGPSGLANRNHATDAHEHGRMPGSLYMVFAG